MRNLNLVTIVILIFNLTPLLSDAQPEVDTMKNEFIISKGNRMILEPILEKGDIIGFKEIAMEESLIHKQKDLMNQLLLVRVENDKVENERIIIDFNILVDKDGKKTTYLLVFNPFKEKRLIYDAEMSNDQKSYEATSIVPIEAGIGGIEYWPYFIGHFKLKNFRLID